MNSTAIWLFVLSMAATPPYNLPAWQHAAISAVALSMLAGNAVKCFVGMSPSEVERMRERSTSTYPFAEDFVQTQDPTVQRPYRFNVYRTHWLARLVNKLEKLFSK